MDYYVNHKNYQHCSKKLNTVDFASNVSQKALIHFILNQIYVFLDFSQNYDLFISLT